MIIEEGKVSTDVEQVHNGDIVDIRLIRRPENVTESTLADIFASQLKGRAVFCFDDKHWYLWNGERWQKDNQKQMLLRSAEFVREIAKLAVDCDEPDIARRVLGFLSAQKPENQEKLAKPRLGIHLTDFDADPMQLCVENGVIDLATGKLLEPEPSMHHSKMAGLAYDAYANCPSIMQFLKDIFPDEPELLEYVQKVAGYALTGSTKEQCLFMLLGGGANGKSTLVSLLTKLMGGYAANTAASTLMASSNN